MKHAPLIAIAALAGFTTSAVSAEKFDPNSAATMRIAADSKAQSHPANAFRPTPNALPDITSQVGITIGGHAAPWGGVIVLTPADAVLQSGGQCAFNVSYDMKNIGAAATAPAFTNRLRDGATVISQQSGLSLASGESRVINTQAYLAPGGHGVSLMLDDGLVVTESNEANNLFRVKVELNGRCDGQPPQGQGKPDLVAVLTDPMSGTVRVKNSGTGAAGPSKLAIHCRKVGHTGGGDGCPEPGVATYSDPAVPGHVVVNIPALAPGAVHTHMLSFWSGLVFTSGEYKFKATADVLNVVAESNEANNVATSTLVQP
jgi:CARDB